MIWALRQEALRKVYTLFQLQDAMTQFVNPPQFRPKIRQICRITTFNAPLTLVQPPTGQTERAEQHEGGKRHPAERDQQCNRFRIQERPQPGGVALPTRNVSKSVSLPAD